MHPLWLHELIEATGASKGTIAGAAGIKPRDGIIGTTSKAISIYFYTRAVVTEAATIGRLYLVPPKMFFCARASSLLTPLRCEIVFCIIFF